MAQQINNLLAEGAPFNTRASLVSTGTNSKVKGITELDELVVAKVTGNVTGTADRAHGLADPVELTVVGDVTGSVLINGTDDVQLLLNLPDTGVVPGQYGVGNTLVTIRVDQEGRIIAIEDHVVSTTTLNAVNRSQLGIANGVALLGADRKLRADQIPDVLVGAVVYRGVWDASTNTPTLADGAGKVGDYYKVSVAGATALGGHNKWAIGDVVIYNGATWDAIDGSASEVLSVAGRVGHVELTKSDVGLSLVNNVPDIDKPVSSFQASAIESSKTQAIAAAATDATSKANAAQTNAVTAASADASEKAVWAKEQAIAAAAADATSKANSAQSAAISTATTKANEAQAAAITASAPRVHGHTMAEVAGLVAALDLKAQFGGAVTTTGPTADWNHASNTKPGAGPYLLMGNGANGPGPATYFYVLTFGYAATDGSGSVTQLAIPYTAAGSSLHFRSRYEGTWSAWQAVSISGHTHAQLVNGAGTATLAANGDFTASGELYNYSDEKLKHLWEDIDDEVIYKLAKVLHGTFLRIDIPKGKRAMGVGAAALKKVFPWAVSKDTNGNLMVNYGAAALVSAIKLSIKVASLEKELRLTHKKHEHDMEYVLAEIDKLKGAKK